MYIVDNITDMGCLNFWVVLWGKREGGCSVVEWLGAGGWAGVGRGLDFKHPN